MKQGWEIKKLSDCFESIKNGANIKQERGAIGIPITRIETLSGGVFNRDRLGYADILSTEKYTSYILDDGDLLLSHINSKTYIGRTVVYNKLENEEIIHGMNLLRLKVIRKILSPYYAYYCFKSDLFRNQVASYRKDAVNQSSIPVTDLKKINIPVPTIAEQEKIVAELDCLSGIIEKKKQQLKEYDALAQSIFYEMFGNPVENEKGWDIKKLKDLSSLIINGTTPKGGAEVYVDSGIMFLRSQNVWRNRIDYDDIAHIDEKTNASMKKSILHKYDILITKTGRINTENSSLGRAALFEGETGSANINGHVYLIRINGDLVLPRFVLSILTSLVYRDYIRKVCVGGIDKRQINKEHVWDFPIIIPSISLQRQYVETIEAIEKQKELIKQSIAETETLFNSRMEYYFN